MLKAAVESRLTEDWREENPDVEPASELLERILKERRERWEQDQLVAYEKKGKKQALAVPLPPLAEQEEIVREVERQLTVLEKVEAEVEVDLKRAARLRQSILKRAFEGRLVPQDPSDEPMGELLERSAS